MTVSVVLRMQEHWFTEILSNLLEIQERKFKRERHSDVEMGQIQKIVLEKERLLWVMRHITISMKILSLLQLKQVTCTYSACMSHVLYTWLVSAFTLVGLNRLPLEQVQHLEPSQAHVRWSFARSHEMARQSWFHCRSSTTWGPDSAARSSLIVLAHVFNSSPTRFRQLGREVERSTSRMSSPSWRRAMCPNHQRWRWSRTGGRGQRFRRRRRIVVGTRSIRRHRRM